MKQSGNTQPNGVKTMTWNSRYLQRKNQVFVINNIMAQSKYIQSVLDAAGGRPKINSMVQRKD